MGLAKEKRVFLGYYGSGPGMYLTDELMKSWSWRVLTHGQKVVLLSVVRTYSKASHGGKIPVRSGLVLTHGICPDVDSETFYIARNRLCEVGFIERAPGMKRGIPGEADRFRECAGWMKYEPAPEERERLEHRAMMKARKVKSDCKRLAEYAEKTESSTEKPCTQPPEKPRVGKGKQESLPPEKPCEHKEGRAVHGKTARLYVTTPTGSWSPSASLTSLAEWESLGKRESNFAPAPKKRRMQVSPKFAAAEAAWAARKAEAVQ